MSKKLTDCPSNLKEAIDWILRVTGKDGQGPDNTPALAKAVKELLEEVIEFASGTDVDIQNVISAFSTGNGDIITKLADGLRHFIGYDGSNGIIKHSNKGIGASNDPLERLQDAVLGFVCGMIKNLEKYVHNPQAAMKTLTDNKANFAKAVQQDLTLNSKSAFDFKNVLQELKKVTDFRGKSDSLSTLAGAFKEYVKKVLQAVVDDTYVKQAIITNSNDVKELVQELKSNFEKTVDALKTQTATQPINVGQGEHKTHMDAMYETENGTFKKLHDAVNPNSAKIKQPKAKALVNAVYISASSSLSQLQGGYKSYYQGAEWPQLNTNGNHTTCAKIFLACLPLIFGNLGRLYWKCKQDKAHGGWKHMQLDGKGKGTDEGKDLKNFMDLMSFSAHWLNGGKKGEDVESVMKTSFNEFSIASDGSGQSYADFLKKFKTTGIEKWKGSPAADNHFLSGLYLCSTSYFRHQHQKNAAQARPPSSIREMLYWLMGLTVTPQFDSLLDHFSTVVPADFKVAISGSSKKDETLKPDDLAGHFITASLSSSWILGTIQGPGSADNPLLHEIYCSVDLSYPSSPSALLSKLADYAYALQFQLHFLYQQCSNTYTKACGWNECTYGQGVNTNDSNGKIVSSHICPVGCTTSGHKNSDHASGYCEHTGCGENTNASPLQAFLTDKLRGFSRGHPSSHSRHLSDCSGYTCHVPMDFESHLRADDKYQGSHISVTLRPFCGGFNTPLRQLSEKLGCLTKRTPRTLGDLFGFTWHLNGQLFNSNGSATVDLLLAKFFKTLGLTKSSWREISKLNPSSVLKEVQQKIAAIISSSQTQSTQSGIEKSLTVFSGLPFLYQLFMVTPEESLPARLFKLNETDHHDRRNPINHDDLWSLQNPQCTDQSCGKYLSPLCYSTGTTFDPRHASSYLSWVLYLSDDLEAGFQEMLDEFTNIDCSKTGCQSCNGNHRSGTSSCSCPSVVQCGGTLPLLYRHGFRYNNPLALKDGWYNDGSSWKKQDSYIRKCSHLASQLNNLLQTNSPLDNLLTTIDTFLYAIRWEFFSKLSGFWTIYVCIILYTFFLLLDTLRVRYHLHFPSSNSIAPISLLGTGKVPALKKFTKLTYFIP